jgi:hypothetical protein
MEDTDIERNVKRRGLWDCKHWLVS